MRRAAALAIALAICLGGAAEARAEFTPGAASLGDPFFAKAGNGGYDLALRYRPRDNHLRGKATITASATQDLSAFDLDYRGPELTAVKVNGARAGAERNGQELVITPSAGIPAGSHFTVRVTYKGRPRYVKDPDGSKDGWIPTDDGAFVASASRRAHRPGSRATTTRPTRRPLTSASRSRAASKLCRTAGSSRASGAGRT